MVRRIAVLAVLVAGAIAVAVLLPSAASAKDTSDSVRQAALAWAVKQVGTAERGTTNCSPVIDRWERDMGLRLPPCRVWCGALVHQAYLRARATRSASIRAARGTSCSRRASRRRSPREA